MILACRPVDENYNLASHESHVMNIIQIVPRMPPRTDGIGDHALCLAEQLRKHHNIISTFLVCDPTWRGSSEINGFRVESVRSRDSRAFIDAITRSAHGLNEDLPLLLHFAPYGFAGRGVPVWLYMGLSQWSQRHPLSINIMFHELEAHARSPLSSVFWLSFFQSLLIGALAKISRATLTNTGIYQNKLRNFKTGAVELLPVFSTIGEPTVNLLLKDRIKQLVIFGRSAQRSATYMTDHSDIKEIFDLVQPERIVDIGDSLPGKRKNSLHGVEIIYSGRLPGHDVSQIMGESIGSILHYPSALLGKSSIFAAICAHGAIPFLIGQFDSKEDQNEFIEMRDFVSFHGSSSSATRDDLQELSHRVFHRYQQRNSVAAARRVAGLLELDN
jgi:hypothetical protein